MRAEIESVPQASSMAAHDALSMIQKIAQEFINYDGDVDDDPRLESFETFALRADSLGEEVVDQCAGHLIHLSGLGYHPVVVDDEYESVYGVASGHGELTKIEFLPPDFLLDGTYVGVIDEVGVNEEDETDISDIVQAVPQDNVYRLFGFFHIGKGDKDDIINGPCVRGQKEYYRIVDLASTIIHFVEPTPITAHFETEDYDELVSTLKELARNHNSYIHHRKFRKRSHQSQVDELQRLIDFSNNLLPISGMRASYNSSVTYGIDATSDYGLSPNHETGYSCGKILGINSVEMLPLLRGSKIESHTGNIGSRNSLCLVVANEEEQGKIEYVPIDPDHETFDIVIVSPFSSEI